MKDLKNIVKILNINKLNTVLGWTLADTQNIKALIINTLTNVLADKKCPLQRTKNVQLDSGYLIVNQIVKLSCVR